MNTGRDIVREESLSESEIDNVSHLSPRVLSDRLEYDLTNHENSLAMLEKGTFNQIKVYLKALPNLFLLSYPKQKVQEFSGGIRQFIAIHNNIYLDSEQKDTLFNILINKKQYKNFLESLFNDNNEYLLNNTQLLINIYKATLKFSKTTHLDNNHFKWPLSAKLNDLVLKNILFYQEKASKELFDLFLEDYFCKKSTFNFPEDSMATFRNLMQYINNSFNHLYSIKDILQTRDDYIAKINNNNLRLRQHNQLPDNANLDIFDAKKDDFTKEIIKLAQLRILNLVLSIMRGPKSFEYTTKEQQSIVEFLKPTNNRWSFSQCKIKPYSPLEIFKQIMANPHDKNIDVNLNTLSTRIDAKIKARGGVLARNIYKGYQDAIKLPDGFVCLDLNPAKPPAEEKHIRYDENRAARVSKRH